MTRFLVDENLPKSSCHQQAHAGFDVVHVRDEGLGGVRMTRF
ncbi:MAG: DUF5615 family PIN-like protein [Myxococcales bacterium]|nr:DUF5615 family PIN-like protein [Myxococcales bacterium]